MFKIHNFKNPWQQFTPIGNQFILQKYNFSQILNQEIYLKSTKSNLINTILFYKMILTQKETLNGSFSMLKTYQKTL